MDIQVQYCIYLKTVEWYFYIYSCSGLNDHLCFNDTCILNGRCNGIVECPNGEDEYWCSSDKPP
ncbi:unnamed protein product, partial [Rotaria sp. Silwood2]